MPVSQRVQRNFIFTDNVRILYLSCNVKKVGKLVRFRQKGQKQASFLAFHKCCHGCLLRGPRYQFHTCLRPPQYIATGYQESLFVGWKVYSSSTNKAKNYSCSISVQQMYWLQEKNMYSPSVVQRLFHSDWFRGTRHQLFSHAN